MNIYIYTHTNHIFILVDMTWLVPLLIVGRFFENGDFFVRSSCRIFFCCVNHGISIHTFKNHRNLNCLGVQVLQISPSFTTTVKQKQNPSRFACSNSWYLIHKKLFPENLPYVAKGFLLWWITNGETNTWKLNYKPILLGFASWI